MKGIGIDECDVAPLVGAWIEILPSGTHELIKIVAPLVGAWIEISAFGFSTTQENVAPLVGAWIEIRNNIVISSSALSLLL